MKKIMLFMTATILAMSLSAAPVDEFAAKKIAKNYLTNQHYAGKMMAPAALNPVLLKAEMGNVKVNQPVYYIYNTSTTFVVVAGDDRAEEILMVGDRPLKDINNLPQGMRDISDHVPAGAPGSATHERANPSEVKRDHLRPAVDLQLGPGSTLLQPV